MFEPLLWNESHSSAVFANSHKPYRQKCCCSHPSWTSALEPVARAVGASPPVRCTSVHGAKDGSPVAFPNRLRICRLMYKPLTHGSCKLDPRHYRNRRLALIKKRAIRVTQACAARRAIPQYFQKRIKHKLLAKKSASQEEDCARADYKQSATNRTKGPDNSSTQAPPHINADSVESTALSAVPSPKTAVLDCADALKTVKEYYSIQSAIRLLLSMLQERMEEVETMQKKRILPDPKEEIMETATTVIAKDDGLVACNGVAENDSKEPLVKTEITNSTPEHTVKDFDPDKENNVPLASTLESLSPVTVALNRVNSTPSKEDSKEDARPTYSFLEISKSDILDPSYTCDIELEPLESRKNRSIVDSLLNKFNLSPPVKATVPVSFFDGSTDGADGRRSLRDRTKIAARPRYSEIPEEPRKMRVSKVFGKLHKTLNLDLDCTNSNSSTEFYGFDEGEVVKLDKPSLPGLLPTPIVKKSQPFAPFLTYGSCIEAQQSKSETETETRSDLFREEGLISFGSVPPRLECPQRPTDMVRPRTVAQKRILVQRENDIRYVMIDNESKIFQFLKKRSRNIDAALDFCRMKELQDQQIPFTRCTWRALAWLRSEKGRYFFQKMTIDNRTIKLSGCRGNHRAQYLAKNTLYSSPVIASRGHRYHYVSNCHCPNFPEGVTINISQDNAGQRKKSEAPSLPVDTSKYLFHGSSNNANYQMKRSYPGTKPGPLSSKCLQPTPDEDPCLGPLEIFKMPKVELEVFPKLNRPLDGFVKPYLKMILPHDDITENWARFAVSTLTAPKEGAQEQDIKFKDDQEERSFVFELPYQNDQRRMLIRRRMMACHGSPMNVDVVRFTKLMDEKLSFRKTIDEALARGERDQIDADELICADVLSELTDSVAISLAEDVFEKEDPAIEYVKKKEEIRALLNEPKSVPVKADTSELAAGVKTTPIPSPSVAPQNDVGVDAAGSAVNGTASECNKTVDPAKLKLLREMKRLNATIIEGPSEPVASTTESCRQQRCDPQYCSKGCICDILFSSQAIAMANMHRKQHCGQIDCVFGCICGFEEKSNRTIQAKADQGEEEEGETALSIAEQRYLREKATACLAKEEREFTPTVILTKNTTVLVQNKESECRRLKKKPKKYDDYYNDQSVQSLLNGGSVKDVSGYISKPPPNAKPLTELERMRHAHVLLNKLTMLEDIEPLCMVHDLYRCFCGGKATQGKPFSFTEENYISIPAKTSIASDMAPLEVVTQAGGRMIKGGGVQTSSKNRAKDQEVIEYSVDATSSPLVNVRKRLYSFEKPHSEYSDSIDERLSRPPQVAGQRRRRDSSEESYKPPNGRKVAKKNPKAAMNNDAMSDYFHGTIRARRASVAPGHIFARGDPTLRKPSTVTQPTAVPNKRLSLTARRSSIASPHLLLQKKAVKSANATSSRSEEFERSTVDNSHYTIIKPTIGSSGSSKINSLILKRVTSQAMDPETPSTSSPTATKSAIANQAALYKKGQPTIMRHMSVRELKQLMMRECKNAMDETEKSIAANSDRKAPVVKILLVDSEENIDNEPRLNILSDGTKKLVISGKRRSFVENSEFRNGYPPARTVPCRSRTVYVVEMATEASVVDVQSKVVKSPAKKMYNQNTELQSSSDTFDANLSRLHPTQEAGGGGGTPAEKTDRLLCSLMHHINEMLRRNNLDISPGKKGILHICRWKQLLSSFALGEIDVLDLTLTNGTEMTVITKNPSVQQLLPNVKYQISANRVTIDKLSAAERPSLLMKMVVSQVDNVKMNSLALVLYGNKNFWHFCGFLKANEKCFKTDSNVLTTPSTEANAKVKARLREYYQKTFPRSSTMPSSDTANSRTIQKQGTSNDQQNSSSSSSSNSKQGGPATVSLSTQSNIEILRKSAQQVRYPLGMLPGLSGNSNGGEGCRWMRLKIENDFSHMYIQSWQCCITYGTIKKAIYDANRMKKSVCLETPIPRDQLKTQLLPYVYALPKEGHSLFLGPYPCSETKVDVILCQSVKGSLYEREVYERLHDIPTNGTTKRTTGTWVDAVTSRVASLNIVPQRHLIGEEKKTTCASSMASTSQRSLLKRNNIPSVTMAGTSNGTATVDGTELNSGRNVVISPSDSDNDDDVVVLETNQDDNNTTIRTVNVSANVQKQPLRKELSAGCNAVDLLKLVQGTMKQNQQKKREIELGLQLHRSSTNKAPQAPVTVARDDATRKRIAPEPDVVSFTAPKIPRRSDPAFENTVATNQGTKVAPASTIQSTGFRRLSLSGPRLLKTGQQGNVCSTIMITPLDKTEKAISVKITQNSDLLPTAQKAKNIKEPLDRRSSGAMKVPSSAPSSQLPPVPRSRLNSVAVERFNRSPPPLLQLDEDDVVLVDDDDEEEAVSNGGTAYKPSSGGPNVERGTAATQSIASVSNDDSDFSPTGGKKKFLSKEEFWKISHKVDLSKTGQQNGYNYDRATGVLKINRSLLNALQRDGVLQQSVGGGNNTLPKTASSVPATNTNNTTSITAVPSNARPVGVASSSTPTATKTMPRMKVVPRVTTTPATATVYADAPEKSSSDSGAGDDASIATPSRTNGTTTTNSAINLKYLNDAQKDRKMLMQPHTKGVLESKIPGLGLVEAVRFNQEVIINLKELTVKKQLVSVPNLEAAVTLLNQFIQRNTYTFKPLDLVIQWQFKERVSPLITANKLTSRISQCCVVTPHGLINLFKQEQIETMKTVAPKLYEDLLMLKLTMLCFDKKRYEEEKCHEDEDKVYERARETISTMASKAQLLRQQICSMEQNIKTNEAKLRKLKQEAGPLLKEVDNAPASSSRESVIVIDDD